MFKITEVRTFDEPVWDKFSLSEDEIQTWGSREWALNKRRSRYQSVMKVLKPNQVYEFVSSELSPDFFSLPGQRDMPSVNISAIVGENGMGKSSLIELMLRIFNNVAYALKLAFKDYGEYKLRFIRDIYASLSFVMENKLYTVVQKDNLIRMLVVVNGGQSNNNESYEELWHFDFDKRKEVNKGLRFFTSTGQEASEDSKKDVKELCRRMLCGFFYTIAVNYSAYSFNLLDLQPEYTENYELESYEDFDNAPWRIDSDSRIWIHSIFHKNDSYQLPLVLAPYRKNGNINFNNEQNLSRDRLYTLAISENSPLANLLEGKKPFSFLFDMNSRFSVYSPRYDYVSPGLEQEIKWIYDLHVNDSQSEDLGDEIPYSRKGVSAFCEKIINIWSQTVGLDLKELGKKLDEQSKGDGGRALSYLVYKTVKIAGNYKKYNAYSNDLSSVLTTMLKGQSDWSPSEVRIAKYVYALYNKDDSHITLKLRRVIALLIYQHSTTKEKEVELWVYRDRINFILQNREDKLKELEEFVYDKEKGITPHLLKEEELMPSPCFLTDLLFVIVEPKDKVDVSSDKKPGKLKARSLSSGERQLLNVLCTIVYHLFNLRSKFSDNDRVVSGGTNEDLKYPYVNIIMDEGELYFHPKYQTRFVKALLMAIATMQLSNKIVGINIICTTHSPFILSDIPNCNILFLKDGLPVDMKNSKTFCANVYDILANGFFMDRFVGDFAFDKVRALMECIEHRERGINNALRDEIELIGDDYVRSALLKKYDEVFAYENDLRSERERLLRRLNEINDKLGD